MSYREAFEKATQHFEMVGDNATAAKLRDVLADFAGHDARAARLAELLARCLPIIDQHVCYASTTAEHEPNALGVEIRKAFSPFHPDDDTNAVHASALAANELACALQNLLNGIRFDLVTVDAIADETWANALRRCDRALAAYRNGGQANG